MTQPPGGSPPPLPDARVVEISGTTGKLLSDELDRRLSPVPAGVGARVVVDLTACDHLGSAAWAVLVSQAKRLARGGGALSLTGLSGVATEEHRSLELHSILPTFASRTLALSAIGASSLPSVGAAPPFPGDQRNAAVMTRGGPPRAQAPSQVAIEVRDLPGDVPVTFVEVRGTVDSGTSRELDHALQPLEKPGVRIVISLAGAEYVASSAWGTLLNAANHVRRISGRLVLCAMPPGIAAAYKFMNVETLLPHHLDLDSALESLRKGQE